MDDLMYRGGWNAEVAAQSVLGKAHGLHEVLKQDFTGVDGGEGVCGIHSVVEDSTIRVGIMLKCAGWTWPYISSIQSVGNLQSQRLEYLLRSLEV